MFSQPETLVKVENGDEMKCVHYYFFRKRNMTTDPFQSNKAANKIKHNLLFITNIVSLEPGVGGSTFRASSILRFLCTCTDYFSSPSSVQLNIQ